MQSLVIGFLDYNETKKYRGVNFRLALADGLLVLQNKVALKILRLHREGERDLDNHNFHSTDTTDGDGVDRLSEAIRIVSQTILILELKLSNICISSDLFRNRRVDNDPFAWPSLRRFHIETDTIVVPDSS